MNLFILSELRPGFAHVGWSVSYSLEETLTELFEPIFIYPQENHLLQPLRQLGFSHERLEPLEWRLQRFFKVWYQIETLPYLKLNSSSPNVLLAIGLTPNFLFSLQALDPLLQQFDLRLAYLLDGFDPRWLHHSITPLLDHLFVIDKDLANSIQQLHDVQTTFLPLAINTAKFHAPTLPRWIDIINYGRGNDQVHHCLQQHFNQDSDQRMYFHSTFASRQVWNQQEHITLMRKLLSRSKISLCFEASNTARFCGRSPLLFRWLEAWAAGCTVVGRKPFGAGVAELMDWKNSTIELPENDADWIPFFEALLSDEVTLALNSKRNYQACIRRHDWRYRIQDLLTAVNLPIPETLQRSIGQIQQIVETESLSYFRAEGIVN